MKGKREEGKDEERGIIFSKDHITEKAQILES